LFGGTICRHTKSPFAAMNLHEWERIVRAAIVIAVIVIAVMIVAAPAANAEGAAPDQGVVGGWAPVPPLQDQSSIGNYCIHRNLVYSMGDVLCAGGQGLVCVPPPGAATGGRAYWSAVQVSRGDINWSPPAHCGK
jgi:hypothetical protein